MNKYILIMCLLTCGLPLTGHVVTDAYAGELDDFYQQKRDSDAAIQRRMDETVNNELNNSYRGNWTTFYGDGMSTSVGPNGHSCYTMYGSGMSTTDCR